MFACQAGWDHVLINESNKENLEVLWEGWLEVSVIPKPEDAPWQYRFLFYSFTTSSLELWLNAESAYLSK